MSSGSTSQRVESSAQNQPGGSPSNSPLPERHDQVSETAVDSGNSAPVRLARSRSVTVDGAVGSGTESLEQQLEDQEMESLLASFKEGLSPEERQLFELRFTEGLAQESAAERVGLTRIQVRRREKGLKQRLLDFLQSRGYLQNIQAKGWGFLKGRGEA